MPGRLPPRRVTVQFEFRDDERGRYWLLLDGGDVSVCMDPPPFDVDVWVETDLKSLYQVWLGRMDYHEALERGRLDVYGSPTLEKAFPTWFAWSPASGLVGEAWRRDRNEA